MDSALFDDAQLDAIYRYWLSKRKAGALPSRADIKPGELGSAIRLLNLIDVVRGASGLRFRHRLVGTGIIEGLGRDVTGQYVSEALYGASAAEMIEGLTRIVESGLPYRRRARLDWNNQKWLMMETAELPLAGAGGEVAMIMRGAAFQPAEPPLPLVFAPLPLP